MSRDMTPKSKRGHALAFDHFMTGASLADFMQECIELRATTKPLKALFTATDWVVCPECGEECELGVDGREWGGREKSTIATREHLLPQSERRDHSWRNQIVLCQECNHGRGTHDWRKWYSRAATYAAWQGIAAEYQSIFTGIFRGV